MLSLSVFLKRRRSHFSQRGREAGHRLSPQLLLFVVGSRYRACKM